MVIEYAIGVDIGATNLRVAFGDNRGKIYKRITERTPTTGDELAISHRISEMIKNLLTRGELEKVKGIGIGTIGPLDLKRGAIVNTPNLPFKYIPLREPLQETFKLPVYILNDCVTAVVGERYFGIGKGVDNLVYITLSTGIGGGVYVDSHLLIGKDGNAHEIGHIVIDYEGRLVCGCGKRGHWEAYCSGKNIPNFVKLLMKDRGRKEVEKSKLFKLVNEGRLTAKDVFDSAKGGDQFAREVVEEIGRLNAIGFANVTNVYDPELITVGGSVALNNPKLVIEPIRRYIDEYVINRTPKIEITPLGGDIVLLGALALVFHPPK